MLILLIGQFLESILYHNSKYKPTADLYIGERYVYCNTKNNKTL